MSPLIGLRSFPFALLLGAAICACTDPAPVFPQVRRIENLAQAIGGPGASARVGDFLLENDQIRAVIEQGGVSPMPLDIGGGLIDLDNVRTQQEFSAGRGLDLLGTINPVANFYLAKAQGERTVRMTSHARGAEVTTAAEGGPLQKILDAIGLLIQRKFINPTFNHSDLRLYNEYELRPGERFLRIRTTVGFDVPFCRPGSNDRCNPECDDINYDSDCQCETRPARCAGGGRVMEASPLPDRPEPMGLTDLLLGDLPRPLGTHTCQTAADCDASASEACVDITTALGGQSRVCRKPGAYDAGLFLGDMLIFGGHLGLFIENTGFDTETDIRRLFERGEDTLSTPLKLDSVLALGDRVSYGYHASKGKILVPIFGGPFSMGVSAGAACRHDQPGCLAGALIRTERWISVGQGDASSAQEPIYQVRGVATGTVQGNVRWSKSGTAVSGARVFALQDPRSLACDQDCIARCGDLSTVSDATASTWAVSELIQANRCRTRTDTYLEGHAGIVSQATTDVGVDPLKDGNYRLVLPAGRYVVVVVTSEFISSALRAIHLSAGETAGASFTVLDPATLDYSIFDERGKFTAGRIAVGRCFPQSPCRQNADCGEGLQCQAGACACPRTALAPTELGGPRLSDGMIALSETAQGKGTLRLPAGRYEILFSRGPTYSTDRQELTLSSGQATAVRGVVLRQIQRPGWTAADFHVHAERSIDAALPLRDRVTSFLAQDMDVMSSSDHDVLTRYTDLIEQMGATTQLKGVVGVEVTTQELGHFLGYPLEYRQWTHDSPPVRVFGDGAPEWREKTPEQIFEAIRASQVQGQPVIVEVPHPYSYFDYYGIDPVSLEPTNSVISLFNPLVDAKNFSGKFEAMELLNSKSVDLFRRPTVGDIRRYSRGLDALVRQRRAGDIDDAAFWRESYTLSTDVARDIIHRTPAEQRAALSGLGNAIACKCGSNGDCPAGKVCDEAKLACVLPSELTQGAAPPDEALCRSLRGVVDDWFNMLNRGVRRTGVGGSDVHGVYDDAATPRTYVQTRPTFGPWVSEKELVDGIVAGRVSVSNGPMIHFSINEASLGETVAVAARSALQLRLRVETADWYDVDRVEVYRNGELIHWFRGCSSTRADEWEPHDHPCLPLSSATRWVLDTSLSDTPEVDSWYVVIAYGLDGRSLAPVHSSATLSRFGTFEVAQRVYDLVPRLGDLRVPRFPSLYPAFPLAITNPIWIDLGGNGWQPLRPPPTWCIKGTDWGCP